MNGLTREQILAMEPGRELDEAVLKYVFGWKHLVGPNEEQIVDGEGNAHMFGESGCFENVDWFGQVKEITGINTDFSTDISAAFEVLDHLIKQGAEVNVGFYKEWDCDIDYPIGCNWRATGKTAAEAIAKCALLAVMVG